MEKLFTKEVKIAPVAIVGIVILFFGMNFLKGLSLFSATKTYLMSFPDAKGLAKSTAVYADGYKVGTVTAIDYDYEKAGNITVEAELDPNLRIPAGTKAIIESDLMGNMKVSLLLANTEVLTDNLARIDIDGTMAKVNNTLDNVEKMTQALNNNEGTLGLMMRDRTLYDNLNNVVSNADSLVTDLKAHPKRYVHFSVFGKKDK